MSKKLWTFALCLLFLTAAFVPSQKAHAQAKFGIKAGINFADLKYEPKDQTNGTPDANSLTSFHAGIIADLPLTEGLALQPGVMLSGKGSKVEYSGVLGTYTKEINPLYIEVPVNILFKPQIGTGTKLYFGLGPYFGFGIAGKANFSGETPAGDFYTDHDLSFGNDSDDDLKATDVGGNILAGFEFSNGLLIGAQYGLSFTNNASGGNDDAPKILRNKVLSISLGYLF